jgi:hypothetical protein
MKKRLKRNEKSMQVVSDFGKYKGRPVQQVNKIQLRKGAFTMNKKLLKLIGGSVLSAMLLAGCATDNQEPPPEDDTIMEDQGENGGNGGNGGMNGTEDENQNGDLLEDENTENEEIIEEQGDLQDENNKDQ